MGFVETVEIREERADSHRSHKPRERLAASQWKRWNGRHR